MKIINNLKLPFEYPFKEAISIYWERTKQTLSVLLYFLIFFAIFVMSRYVFVLNQDFFLHNLDFLIPFGVALVVANTLIILLSSSEIEIKIMDKVSLIIKK